MTERQRPQGPKPPAQAVDMNKTLEERAAAIMGISSEDSDDSIMPPKIAGRQDDLLASDPLTSDTFTAQDVKMDLGDLIPDLRSVVGQNTELKELAIMMEQVSGGIDLGIDKKTRVRSSNEPETIYDPNLNPKLINVLAWALTEPSTGTALSGKQVVQFIKVASSKNVPAVSLLRQRIWPIMRRRLVSVEGAEAKSRKPIHDNEETQVNRRLIMLLDFDVFDELQSESRRMDYCPLTYLQKLVAGGLLAAEF